MSEIYRNGKRYGGGTPLPTGGTQGQALLKKSSTDGDIEWGTVSGVPDGGTTGQALVKKSNTDKDVEWDDVTGIPDGGTTGQALVKKSNSDRDVEWDDVSAALPSGGTTGQALVKKSNSDQDVEWSTVEGALPVGGTKGQALVKKSSTDGDVEWNDVDGLPSGGTAGQVLTKKSSTDGDAEWKTAESVPSGGTTGQVLTKKSNSDGDAEWQTPLSLGETNTTAYAGDKGKANADHIGDLATLDTTVQTDLVSAVNEVVSSVEEVESKIPQIATLPTADNTNVGRIYQYTGTTDSSYTNGFYYKCTEDTSTSPSTYSWANVKVQAGTVSRDLLKVEYDALTEAEKTDGTVYYITDVSPVNPELQNYGFTPIGTIISVMGNAAPKNYLKCDGTEYPIDVFMDLALYFEQQFGAKNFFGGDGTTTFAVPNLQGEFLRGSGTNSHENQGGGGTVGEHQDGTEIPYMTNGGSNGISVFSYSTAGGRALTNNYDSISMPAIQFRGFSGAVTATTNNGLVTTRPTNTSVLYCIAYKNVFIESIDSQNIYSTDEKVVGQWIDGKPLYQKTVDCGALPNNTTKYIFVDNNIKVINIYGMATGDEVKPLPFSHTSSNYSIMLDFRNGRIFLNTASDYSTYYAYVTIQYTKTTD